MNKVNYKIAVIGGDSRMLYAANALSDTFSLCTVYGNRAPINDYERFERSASLEEALSGADILLLPIPCLEGDYIKAPFYDGDIALSKIEGLLKTSCTVFAGLPCRKIGSGAFIDYGKDEKFTKGNAYLTAEGCLSLAKSHIDLSLKDAKCAILGFGRIGKELCKLFSFLESETSVFARNPRDRELCTLFGAKGYSFESFEAHKGDFDLIINTVPSIEISKLYELCPKSSQIIELALKEEKGKNVILAPSLPARYSPKSAGLLIFECIKDYLKEGEKE